MSATNRRDTKDKDVASKKRQRRPEAARRIEARRAEKRTRLLDAAQMILEERGAGDISLRAVARQANIAPATVYEYFPSLDGLLQALAERPRTKLRACLAAAQDDSTGMATDLMVRLAIAYVRFARRQPAAFQLMFERRDPPEGGPKRSLDTHPVMQPLLDAARAGQLSGELHPDDDPEHIAWGLWALSHGLASLRASSGPVAAERADEADISVLQAHARGWLS